MLGYLDFLFLSFHGRVGRTTYWLASLGLCVLEVLLVLGLLKLSHGTLDQLMALDHAGTALPREMAESLMLHIGLPVMIIGLLFLYPAYAVTAKRWHDRGKSGWWSLITLVPIIGGLWFLIEVGFLGPDEGVNQYGTR